MTFLLDTHILLFWFSRDSILTTAESRIVNNASEENPLLVSGISLWEIATLHRLGRIALGLPLRDWLERAVAPPLVRLIGISPAIAAAVAALPESFHRDPADRIIVASAQINGAIIVTRDRRIIEAGIVETSANLHR
jgi:PIN domain nuclease of toxin-antitoxin system